MTVLTKCVTRIVPEIWNNRGLRSLVVTLAPEGIRFRLKGTRTSYLLPYARGFQSAAKLAADAQVVARYNKRHAKHGKVA